MEWAAAATARLVMYPCMDNQVLNLVAFMPAEVAGDLGEGMYLDHRNRLTVRLPGVWG